MQRSAAYILTAALLAPLLPFPAHATTNPPAPQRCGAGRDMYEVAVPGAPMSAVATPDEQTVFVSLNSTEPRQFNGIAVLRCTGGRYRFERTIPLESQPTIAALTSEGKMLVVPDDSFIAFVDVERALSGVGDPIAGFIEDVPGDDGGAIYAAISPDDRFAFVAEEQSGKLSVIDMQKVRAGGAIAHDDIVSEFLIGNAPVGLIFSKDGRYLFATVQVALKRYRYARTCAPEMVPAVTNEAPGAIVTIDVAKAVSDPDRAVVSNIPAGCHPVRAALSPDGSTLWVTARKSNTVLAFSTEKLIAGSAGAQIAKVNVGSAPVPIIVTADGKYVLAGNSNRFAQAGGGNQELVVIDAHAHLAVGGIPVGIFPRQLTQTRSGSTIFLANYGSNTITVIDPAAIPSLLRP